MITAKELREIISNAQKERTEMLTNGVHKWLEETVIPAITERAKSCINYINIPYPLDFTEAQKIMAQTMLREQGYEIDTFFITTIEIRY